MTLVGQVTALASRIATEIKAVRTALNAVSSWPKATVRVVAVDTIALSGLPTIDSRTLAVGDRVLVTANTTSTNGIYVAGTGAWTRATDADTGSKLIGALVRVVDGLTYAGTSWECTQTGTSVISHSWFRDLNTGNLGSNTPQPLGAFGASGTAVRPSREDHVHTHADTGWVEMTAASGITKTTGAYRIVNGVCYVRGQWAYNAAQAVSTTGGMTDVLLTSLPVGARPLVHHFTTFWLQSAVQGIGYVSSSDGGIRVQAADARGTAYSLSAGGLAQFSTSFALS